MGTSKTNNILNCLKKSNFENALLQKWQPRTPAMAANFTDHIWTVKELLTTLPVLSINT